MKSKTYGGPLSKQEARAEVNRLVRKAKHELTKLDTVSEFTTTDLLELFVGNLLKRLGVPIE